MSAEVRQLAEVLRQTVTPERNVRKKAEEELEKLGKQAAYGIMVLQVAAAEDIALEIRVAAAINFKNHVKYHWAPGEGSDHRPMGDDEKMQVKVLIVGLMLKSPPLVRAQISEALTIVSNHDFPDKWPQLLPELSSKLGTTDINTLNGVLHTANSVFKRFRNQYMTDKLSDELKASQEAFVKPLLSVLEVLWQGVQGNQQNVEVLKVAMSCLRLCCRIFYSLNALGLTEMVEENLKGFMGQFLRLLEYENPLLDERDSEKESELDAVKAAVCENINLFISINEEEFEEFLRQFVTAVWSLLVKVTQESGQDRLVMTAIRFLTSVARSVHHSLFSQENALQQICEKIILPNLKLREEDEELFEMNPIDYIRRDTEGSDSDTRRRAAADLVRALTDKFPRDVTQLFTGYVTVLLQEYRGNPGVNYKAKDCAIYMVVALTVKGRTAAQGATTTNELVPLIPFFNEQILPEIQAGGGVNDMPVLKADALKFVTTFRMQIPKQTHLAVFPHLISLLGAESFVVHSYAAIAIERLLSLKEGGKLRLSPQDLAPHLHSLLEKLFAGLSLPDSSENQYIMRCVMRVIQFCGPQIAPVAHVCLQALAGKLLKVCENPTEPGFNHYLFESVAALIRYTCSADAGMVNRMEDTLFPAFELVLQRDVQEFHPYVFQIFAQLIDLRRPPIPDVYLQIFPPMLTHIFWERHGNVPALTKLIQAYLKKLASEITKAGHLEGILGVFQKLLASKALDHHAFQILDAIYRHVDGVVIERYQKTVWTLLFDRLQRSRTAKYVKGFIGFMGGSLCRYGPIRVSETMDKIQGGIFILLLQQVWLSNMSWVEGKYEQKQVAVGMTKLLCEYPPLLTQDGAELWAKLMDCLVRFLEGRSQNGPEVDDEVEEEPQGYSAAFSQLANALIGEMDPLPEVSDTRAFLAKSLAAFSSSPQGQVWGVFKSKLHPETVQKLTQFCLSANVGLP